MSGGSFDYLCFAEARDLYDKIEQMDSMYSALLEYKGGEAAAAETLELLQIVKHQNSRMQMLKSRLEHVWRQVEWHASCDIDRESVEKAIHEFNGGETSDTDSLEFTGNRQGRCDTSPPIGGY